jgi:phosphate butyryltransferase
MEEGSSDGLAPQAGETLLENEYEILESGLNALSDAVRASGVAGELEEQLRSAAETVHYRKVTGEEALLELLGSVVRASKPPILSTAWEEAWGNLFSHLIETILSSKSKSRIIISRLYGGDPLPAEAERECILCVNPGSTSTKLALYRGLELAASEEVHLPPDYPDSIENRAKAIVEWVKARGIGAGDLTGIACRGGFVAPVPTGTYEVCPAMVEDLAKPRIVHASNMAIPIGLKIKEDFSGSGTILVTTTDPVASDEMETGARMTGIRRILRDGSGAHYLNHRAVHALVCSLLGASGKDLTTIGAHMGGGISILRHVDGRVTDLVNAFSGVPSANRSGNIPLDVLLRAIEEGEISLPELKRYLYKVGGLIDLAGTNDFRALLHFRESGAVTRQRKKIELVVDFMARSVAGAVMQLAAIEKPIDVVILTGGLSRSHEFVGRIRRKLYPYFPVVVVPGAIEHEALVAGHFRARFRPEKLKSYEDSRDALRRLRADERVLIETEVFTHPQLRKKENAPVTSLDELIYLARSMVSKHRAPRIAIVGAENEDAVVAAKQANEEGRFPIAKFLLVGDFYEVNKLAWEYDIKIDGDNYAIVDTDKPVEKAIELYASGAADLLMKGGVKTEEIMRGALTYLKRSGKLEKGRIYSHVGVFQIPTYPKLLTVTDAAVNPNPDLAQKKMILENALTVLRYLNIAKPKVAIISAVETRNPNVESSILAGLLAEEYESRDDCVVEGPLSLDVAIDPHSASEKNYKGRIMGNADILVMPDIEAGNVVYKTLTVSSGAYLAGVVAGGGIPIILASRGDSSRSKLASICLACIVAMKQGSFGEAEKK